MHKENNINITKSMHTGCCYGAMNLHVHGATVGGTKALGGWNESGSFRNCYDHAFPINGLLGAASFNVQKLEEYHLARDELGRSCPSQTTCIFQFSHLFSEPPTDIVGHLFPWVEVELTVLEVRMTLSCCNRDIALRQFLKLLQWLHVVLVQDCALLYAWYPHCPIFHFAPFTFPSFLTFSANAVALVTATEEKAQLVFHNLLEHMA